MTFASKTVFVLDYGAGNVQSLRNALECVGVDVQMITDAKQFEVASRIVFPGVGAFASAVEGLKKKGFWDPLKRYLEQGKPFFGICIGLQVLFEDSEESPGIKGLGLIPGRVVRLSADETCAVPHMGWNVLLKEDEGKVLCSGYELNPQRMYFVHSYAAVPSKSNSDWVSAVSEHGNRFISFVQKGNVIASQFHPEKSGSAGLELLRAFVEGKTLFPSWSPFDLGSGNLLSRRVIACLDVRNDDTGKLVVTKGDQYDVRENGGVRRMGDPVEMSERYYRDGVDELAFLNITSFRSNPLGDLPLLQLLRDVSRTVFVPLTIGGGIRDYMDEDGVHWSALDVADAYFRAGADKVSIGSDAVSAAEMFYRNGRKCDGRSSIESISRKYGRQAVVVSIDPKKASEGVYKCTVSGGRVLRDIDAVELAVAVEALGAGELLVNCIDNDGQSKGFDCILLRMVKDAVSIPVIASSGAGCAEHFVQVFEYTRCDAALAAGIFHRGEVSIESVKCVLEKHGMSVRK